MRVPYPNVGPAIIPEGMDPDDAVLFTDMVPTAYQAAEMGGIKTRDTVVVFGAGPNWYHGGPLCLAFCFKHSHRPQKLAAGGFRNGFAVGE